MPRARYLAAFVLAASFGCAAPAEQPRTAEERAEIEAMLVQIENDWVQTAFSRDPSTLERTLADDMVYTVADGSVIGKQEMIESWVDDPNTYTSFVIDDIETHWFGDDVVLVIGGDTSTGTDPDGNAVIASGRFTNVFVERDGIWQMVIGHYTPTS